MKQTEIANVRMVSGALRVCMVEWVPEHKRVHVGALCNVLDNLVKANTIPVKERDNAE